MSDSSALTIGPVECEPGLIALADCDGRQLCRVPTDSAVARRVIEFIEQRFEQAYGAKPRLVVPRLLALTARSGRLLAAVGVRNAGREPLFLEQYTGRPVEQLVPARVTPSREHIAEIVHLAGVEAGVSRHLFAGLTLWLQAHAFEWICFTGTDQLRNSFRRLGIRAHVLGPADPACLPQSAADWGEYYQHDPKVMAINVRAGARSLARTGLLAHCHWLSTNDEQEVRHVDIA